MTDEERDELAKLAALVTKAEEAIHYFGYTNVAGLGIDDKIELGKRRAMLEAEVRETRARYGVFLDLITQRRADEARTHYARTDGGESGT